MIQRDEGSYLIIDYESPLYKEKLPILYRKKKKELLELYLLVQLILSKFLINYFLIAIYILGKIFKKNNVKFFIVSVILINYFY